MRFALVFVFTLFFVHGASQRAHAQAVSPADEEARALFSAGRLAFDAGRYEEALGSFQRAYELSGRPDLLFNVGQAADRLRQDRRAAEAFEAFLAEGAPDSPKRPEVEARLAVLRERIAQEEERQRALDEATRQLAQRDAAPGGDVTGEAWFWVLIGSLAAAAIAGTVAGVALSGTDPEPLLSGDIGPGGVVLALEFP